MIGMGLGGVLFWFVGFEVKKTPRGREEDHNLRKAPKRAQHDDKVEKQQMSSARKRKTNEPTLLHFI